MSEISEAAERRPDNPYDGVEAAITRAFYGDAPRCECCNERNPKCRWRPAYQMMLCPECPKQFPKPTKPLRPRKDGV